MASVKRQNSCIICGKLVGVFVCPGCDEAFCLHHTTEHRERLQRSMDEIIKKFNELADKSSTNYRTDDHQQLLIEQVNDWEKQSINKIRQLADDTRQHIANSVHERSHNLDEQIRRLQQQIDKAKKDGGFFENDLREWTDRLNRLKYYISYQQSIKFDDDNESRTFISRISIREPSFDTRVDDSSSGKIAPKASKNIDEHVLTQSTHGIYSSGKYTFQFKIEDYQVNNSILFGIISNQDVGPTSPFESPTLYGWGGKNIVYIGGKHHEKYDEYRSDFQTGDICELSINCEAKTISFKNRRVNRRYELDVSTKKCPLPWKLSVHVFDSNQDPSDDE